MHLLSLFGIILATTLTAANAQTTFSPEEALFTYTRCMEKNHKGDYELVKKWMAWQLPADLKSACYAKCVLVGLELFDAKTKTFKGDNILAQYNKYKQYTNQDEAAVREFQDAVNDLGTLGHADCISVVQAYRKVLEKFTDVQKNVYFGKKEITDKVYESDPTVKKRDETVFRYCERVNYATGDADLCQLRKTGVANDKHDKHMDCLFHGMRYLDRNGNINPEEIKRDLHLIGVTDKDAEVDKTLKECKVDESRKASSYNDCLFTNPALQPHMMPAFDYREVRSESYRYMLTGPRTYNRDEVKAKVQQYDKDAGC